MECCPNGTLRDYIKSKSKPISEYRISTGKLGDEHVRKNCRRILRNRQVWLYSSRSQNRKYFAEEKHGACHN